MEYRFDGLSAQEVDILCAGLRELPIKIAGDLFGKMLLKIREQESQQQKSAELVAQA